MMSSPDYNTQPTLERGSMISSPTDTVDTVIHNTGGSGDGRLIRDAPQRRSLGNFEPLIRPEEPITAPPEDIHDDEIHPELNSESQRLVRHSHNNSQDKSDTAQRPPHNRSISYDAGTCCYCVSKISFTNILLWVSLVICLIGWSVAIWRSVDGIEIITSVKLRTEYGLEGFPFSDITIIVISIATLLFSIVFLVLSTYSSQSLSSHHLRSSQMNSCVHCFNITMAIFSCTAVILWTLIIAVTMIPITVIFIIHLLFQSDNCVHLPSYGVTGQLSDGTTSDDLLLCGDDLYSWLMKSWDLMTPLIISLGCALLIEVVLMGFIIVISSNSRHLYERKGYLRSSSITKKTNNSEEKQNFI